MFKRLSAALLLFALGGLALFSGHSYAVSTQNFQILSGQVQQGMIMSLTRNPDVIEPANSSNSASMVGVVVPAQPSLDQTTASGVDVQTDGENKVLVSNINGDILVGDKITASALQGVGGKLVGGGWIIATAEGSLDASTPGVVPATVVDSQGHKRQVYVGLLPAVIHVAYYPGGGNSITQSVQNLANTLAGKKVSLQILLLSFLLFIIGLIAAGIITVSAIRGGFLAISRQPLSRYVIVREEWRSFVMALAILIFVMAGCLLLLKFL